LAARILAEALLPAFKASSIIRRKAGVLTDKNLQSLTLQTSLKSKAM
jgi:hypothetical protein